MNSFEYNLKIKSKVRIQNGQFFLKLDVFLFSDNLIWNVIIPAGLFYPCSLIRYRFFLIIYLILKLELAITFKKPGCFFNKFNLPVKEILANLERILRQGNLIDLDFPDLGRCYLQGPMQALSEWIQVPVTLSFLV